MFLQHIAFISQSKGLMNREVREKRHRKGLQNETEKLQDAQNEREKSQNLQNQTLRNVTQNFESVENSAERRILTNSFKRLAKWRRRCVPWGSYQSPKFPNFQVSPKRKSRLCNFNPFPYSRPFNRHRQFH